VKVILVAVIAFVMALSSSPDTVVPVEEEPHHKTV
jgi:hypothetical protein